MDNILFRDWNESGKKRSENQIIGESGIDILRSLFPQEWVIREYSIDYGIDLDVELFEEINEKVYVTKGEHVLFQVKTTDNIEIKKLKVFNSNNSSKDFVECDVVKYSIDTDLISTVERMGSAVPVLLCLVDNVEREGYFVCLNDYIEKILIQKKPNYQKQGTVTINIPVENKISSGKRTIEWYGKRAKLYAFFNLINCQKRDLQYLSNNIEQTIDSFLKKICRLDVWSADILSSFQEKIVYYQEHSSTKQADIMINDAIERGENVDEPVYESTYCGGKVTFRYEAKIHGLHQLWDELCTIADMYESNFRKAYIPTYYWMLINEG